MKYLTLLSFSVILFSSCRKEFATFQKSTPITYARTNKNIENKKTITPIEPILFTSITQTPTFLNKSSIIFPRNLENKDEKEILDKGKKKKQATINRGGGTFLEKLFPNQTQKEKNTTKKRKNPVPFNSTIYTGFIILGIAILLALLSLNSLSLLFGLASIIFLYLGFKWYFRKINRRKVFR